MDKDWKNFLKSLAGTMGVVDSSFIWLHQNVMANEKELAHPRKSPEWVTTAVVEDATVAVRKEVPQWKVSAM